MVSFREADENIKFIDQLSSDHSGPVVFINTFHVSPDEVEAFMAAWTVDGEFMKKQPGYISTQLHRGIAGSTTFINVAAWDSVADMRNAVSQPEFQASMANYPPSASASPHLFEKVSVEGICGA
jgi:heme-degrading monooxygenase HmoA